MEVLVPAVLSGGIVAALVALYKAGPERNVSIATGYSSLLKDTRERVDELEAQLAEERVECDRRIDKMRAEFQHQLDELRQRFDDRLA